MKNVFLFIGIVVVLLSTSCEVINPAEDIPAYLNIETIDVTSSGEEGSSSSNITDAWVYVNNEFLGAFPLPARIPVLEEGEKSVTIFPGVKVNGISSSRNIYPFYQEFEGEFNFAPTEDLTINPTLTYGENAIFQLVEDFETTNHLFFTDLDGDTETFFEGNTDAGFEGGSGMATLREDHLTVSAATNFITTFPDPVTAYVSFLEMDFKTDVNFNVGLLGYDQGGTQIYFNYERTVVKTDEWKKIYFDMKVPLQEAAQTPGIGSYQIVLFGQLSSEALDTMPEAKIYVDNVKLVTF